LCPTNAGASASRVSRSKENRRNRADHAKGWIPAIPATRRLMRRDVEPRSVTCNLDPAAPPAPTLRPARLVGATITAAPPATAQAGVATAMVPMAEAITAVVEAAITAAALAAGEVTEMVAVTVAAVAEMEVGTAATAEEDANKSRPNLHAPCNAWPDGSCARDIGML
jgi:hypothetical protein